MSAERVYTVEKILDKKKRKEGWCYKVKWIGYSAPTWETLANCHSCEDAIEEFEKSRGGATASKPEAKKAESKTSSKKTVDNQQKKLAFPKPGRVYRVESGAKIDKILGVKMFEGYVVAIVLYADKSMEIVPTHAIGENQPEIMVKFYEARLKQSEENAAMAAELQKQDEEEAARDPVESSDVDDDEDELFVEVSADEDEDKEN